jgi:superfamily I DNA/RNA helicase
MLAKDNVPGELVDNIVCGRPYLRNLKHLFVDEAQDLAQEQFQLVMAICNTTGCSLTMVGDPF